MNDWIIPSEKELDAEEVNYLKAHGAVRLIRCKDCKHQYEYRTGSCPYYTTYGSTPPNDWYCADGGEKR